MMTSRIGTKIKRAMARGGYSASSLAREAGVGRSWLEQVITGRVRQPGQDKLARIAPLLGLDLAELLSLTDQLGAAIETRQRGASTDRPEWAVTLESKVDALAARVAALSAQVAAMAEVQQGTASGVAQLAESTGQALQALALARTGAAPLPEPDEKRGPALGMAG